MTTLCQMEISNFLWLILGPIPPLAPTYIPPSHTHPGRGPNLPICQFTKQNHDFESTSSPIALHSANSMVVGSNPSAKGQIILKGLFGVLEFSQ